MKALPKPVVKLNSFFFFFFSLFVALENTCNYILLKIKITLEIILFIYFKHLKALCFCFQECNSR